VFDSFHPGEVNRARQAVWCASGKVFNAGIAAHHLGGPSLVLAAVGGEPLPMIRREFDEMKLRYRFVSTRAATRVCTTILDRRAGTTTELVESGRPLTPDELDEYRRAYADEAARAEAAVIIGSLPVGAPDTLYRDLLEMTPCPAVLDFRGQGLLKTLELEPLLVKPNREELAQTVGRPLDGDDALREAMQSLNGRGARWVAVTQGSGPVWLTSRSQTYRLYPPPVDEVVNPIACGDSMAAAIAWAIRDGREMVEALKLGIAAAVENLGTLLPARLDPARVSQRAELVRVKEG
jgi:1-phosphofructokinase family hexose kinase